MKVHKSIIIVVCALFFMSLAPKASERFRPLFYDQDTDEVEMYFNPDTISRIEMMDPLEDSDMDLFRVYFTDGKYIDVQERSVEAFIKRCKK